MIKRFSVLLALRFLLGGLCQTTGIILLSEVLDFSSGLWLLLQKQKRGGLIRIGNLTVAKQVKLVDVRIRNDRAVGHWEAHRSALFMCHRLRLKDAKTCAMYCLL